MTNIVAYKCQGFGSHLSNDGAFTGQLVLFVRTFIFQ